MDLSRIAIDGHKTIVVDEAARDFANRFTGRNELTTIDTEIQWDNFKKEVLDKSFVHVHKKENRVSFKIQDGDLEKVGVNGCHPRQLIEIALKMMGKSIDQFPADLLPAA